MKSGNPQAIPNTKLISQSKDLFSSEELEDFENDTTPSVLIEPMNSTIQYVSPSDSDYTTTFDSAIDVEEEKSLSLIDNERELIKKALTKHKGRRKPAADELGISERTLYRKIKQYNLDEN